MEMIVIFNKGREAAHSGAPRQAPATVDYPIVSKYEPHHAEVCALSDYAKREWLRGYDHQMARA